MIALQPPLSPSITRHTEGTESPSQRNSLDMSLSRASTDLRSIRLDSHTDNPAKKFFGKVFKRKQDTAGSTTGSTIGRSASIRHVRSPSPNPAAETHVNALPSSPPLGSTEQPAVHPHHSQAHPTFGTLPLVVRRRSSGTIVSADGAVTGLSAPEVDVAATLLGASPTPSFLAERRLTAPSRPIGYTWSVRKWAKKNNEGWAAHLTAAAAAGLEMVNGVATEEGEDDVVFEWVRQRGSGSPSTARGLVSQNGLAAMSSRMSRGKSRSKPNSRSNSRPTSVYDEPILEHEGAPATPGVVPPSPTINLDPRPGAVRRVSGSVSPRRVSPPHSDAEGDHETTSVHTLDMTAEEDSDPEDSETPWTCSVWVKKTGQKQLLGTLTPAPHHPKVVGVLKIPLRLNPVSLQQVKGSGKDGQDEIMSRVKAEVCLTEENLKDVVCTTALWLVAREEFAGLGRKRRPRSQVC